MRGAARLTAIVVLAVFVPLWVREYRRSRRVTGEANP